MSPAEAPSVTASISELAACSGLALVARLADGSLRRPSMAETLPFTLLPPKEGKVWLLATPEARFCNLANTVQGGWIMTMLDTVMALAAQTTLSPGETCPSHETTAKFVRPIVIDSGVMHVTGHVVSRGRTVITLEGRIEDAQGRLHAYGTSTCLVVSRTPVMSAFPMPNRGPLVNATRRIVVTGMGAVTPLAADVETSWSRLLAGRSGIRRLPDDVVGDLPTKIGGVVPSLEEDPDAGFDPNTVFAPKDQRKVDRFILFGLAAAQEALAQARWAPVLEADRLRTATIIASGIGGFPAITEAVRTVDRRGVRRLSPFTVPSFLVNLAAGHISIRYGFKGPLGAPVTACAAGVQAIGDAARLIRTNEADIAVCGGTEACMNIVSLGGFAAARSLSTGFNETPDRASRPFDIMRDGFVMGEGAGVLVIEALSHALARGAKPLAELVGYGTTADAHHITSGPEDGDGARRAMEIAIAQAGISPREVRHLNAHATSTPVGDLGEIEAIKRVFGADSTIAVSGTKSATGHLLGAAGGIEAIFTVLALRDQVAPPTLNLSAPDPAGNGIDFVANKARPMEIDYAISNGFGFGGVNASALFRRWTDKSAAETGGGFRD